MSDIGTIGQWARLVGRHRWLELQLFELLGGWAAEVPELDVKASLAAQSHHHAWHAELWEQRLPGTGELSASAVTRPPSEALVAFFHVLAESSGTESTIEKLTGVHRVLLPRMITSYERHLASARPVADAPTIRSLRLVITDEVEHWREGEALLQSLLRTDADVARAASWQGRLEAVLVAAGGLREA